MTNSLQRRRVILGLFNENKIERVAFGYADLREGGEQGWTHAREQHGQP